MFQHPFSSLLHYDNDNNILCIYAGGDEAGGKAGGDGKKGKGGGGSSGGRTVIEQKDRLAVFDTAVSPQGKKSVIFYSYKGEQNKKIGYIKTKRFDECAAVCPGMVVSSTIWANKFASLFKKEAEDIGVFDLCLVQLSIKSIASNASSSGLMMEIKGFSLLRSGSLAYCALVPHNLLPSSIQESQLLREKFVEGSFISEENRKRLNQVSYSYDLCILSCEKKTNIIVMGGYRA